MSEILFLYPLGWRAIVRAELKRVEFANSSIEFFLNYFQTVFRDL